jgi:hypothetical protein
VSSSQFRNEVSSIRNAARDDSTSKNKGLVDLLDSASAISAFLGNFRGRTNLSSLKEFIPHKEKFDATAALLSDEIGLIQRINKECSLRLGPLFVDFDNATTYVESAVLERGSAMDIIRAAVDGLEVADKWLPFAEFIICAAAHVEGSPDVVSTKERLAAVYSQLTAQRDSAEAKLPNRGVQVRVRSDLEREHRRCAAGGREHRRGRDPAP